MRSRIQLIFTGILVVLALVMTAFAAKATLQTYSAYRQARMSASNPATIEPWMTISSIAQLYHVPESDLYRSLHLQGARSLQQAPLSELAVHYHRSPSDLTLHLQMTVLVDQDLHPPRGVETISALLTFLIASLQQDGYPILWSMVFVAAVGAPIPMGLVLLLAGAFAALGDFNIVLLVLITVSASMCGDSLGYAIGRGLGSKALDWVEQRHWYRSRSSSTIARARAYFTRRGVWAIFLSRFLFSALGGTINLVAGTDRYPYRRFLLYDGAGELLGAIIPLVLGYAFGASWEDVGDLLSTASGFVLTLLVTLFLLRRLVGMVQRAKTADRGRRDQPLPQQTLRTPRSQHTAGEVGERISVSKPVIDGEGTVRILLDEQPSAEMFPEYPP